MSSDAELASSAAILGSYPYDPGMADSDTAFLWESEALRSSKAAKGRHEQRLGRVDRKDADWMTLREATDFTGIPISTLRKWARRDAVASYLTETPVGQLRMVSLRGIQVRAEKLGRELETTSPPATVEIQEPEPEPEREIVEDETAIPETGEPDTDESKVSPAEIPEGTMLVPLDAWNKMLMQLGNLHEAGQQLAAARERAAKAETETTFLRERLNEMRTELTEVKTSSPSAPIIVEAAPQVPVDETPEATDIDHHEDGEDESSSLDIPVRDLGSVDPSGESDDLLDRDDLTLPAYSLAMMKHVYTTWLGRPRR